MDIDTTDKLSAQVYRLESGASILFLLGDCLDQDKYSPEIYAPAVYAVYDLLRDSITEIKQLCGGENDS